MKISFQNGLYHVLYALICLVSRLPMWWHYRVADLMCLILYHVVRYRRKVVRRNLRASFPDKKDWELHALELRIYRYICDLIVETIKYFTISEKEIRRRMLFRNNEGWHQSLREGRSVAIYLGHYCNWEWVSSLALWFEPGIGQPAHIYHPMENKLMDRIFQRMRSRLGSQNIAMSQSLRAILRYQKMGKPVAIGFIADQVPLWDNLHYWTSLLNHPQTPIFTGAERIARQLDMDVYYLDIRRPRRGYYVAEFKLITDKPKEQPEFAITEQYTRMLEQSINLNPQYWLWTHNRWKRTLEAVVRHYVRDKKMQLHDILVYNTPQGEQQYILPGYCEDSQVEGPRKEFKI